MSLVIHPCFAIPYKRFVWVGQTPASLGPELAQTMGFLLNRVSQLRQITRATTEESGKVVLAHPEMPVQSPLDGGGDRKEDVPVCASSPRAGSLGTQQRQKVMYFSCVCLLAWCQKQDFGYYTVLHSCYTDLIDKWDNENNYFLINLSNHRQL